MDLSSLNWFEKFLYKCNTWYWDIPKAYGLVHIILLLFTIGLTIFLCLKFKNASRKTYQIILLIIWVVFISMETFKQISQSFHVKETTHFWKYDFFYFPWQLCSTQYYVLPFVIFLKNEKIRKYFETYIALFVLFGGTITMIYPTTILSKYVLLSLHSLIHHSLMVAVAIFVIVYNRKDFKFLTFIKSIPIFLFFAGMSQPINEMIYSIAKDGGIQMFYLSRFATTTLPILNLIYPHVPYAVFFFIYVLGFIAIAAGINAAIVGILKLIDHIKKTRNPNNIETLDQGSISNNND